MIIRYYYLAVSGPIATTDGQSTCVVEDTQFGPHNLTLVKARLRYIRVLPAQTGCGLISDPDQSLTISGRSLSLRIYREFIGQVVSHQIVGQAQSNFSSPKQTSQQTPQASYSEQH